MCLVLWLAAAAWGCGVRTDPDALAVSSPFDFTSPDPSANGHVFQSLQIVETLIEIDAHGRPVPGLASSWEATDDGRHWRFTILPDVRFHDGTPFDAAAAAHSLKVARSKPGMLANAPIDAIVAPDRLTVAIRVSQPYRPLLALLAHASAGILAPGAYAEDGSVRAVIGTGPYRVTRFTPPHRIDLVRYEGWHGPRPEIERVLFMTGSRSESRALQLLAGQTDIVYALDPASVRRVEQSREATVVSTTVPRTVLLKLNAADPALSQREVRQALSLAIDRDGLARAIMRVPDSAANQLLPPFLAEWHNPRLPRLSRDLPRAASLLESAGWHAGADGRRSRAETPLRLTLMTYADRPELPVLATAIQDQLRAVGVTVDVSVENSSAIPRSHVEGTLQMALVARNFGIVADPLAILLDDFASPGGGDWGAMNWSNAELTADLQQIARGTGAGRASEVSQASAAILAGELPVIPLLFYTQQTGVAARVRNFRFDPYERSFGIAGLRFTER